MFPLAKMMNSGRVVMIKMGTLYLGLLLYQINVVNVRLQNTASYEYFSDIFAYFSRKLTLYIALVRKGERAPFAD